MLVWDLNGFMAIQNRTRNMYVKIVNTKFNARARYLLVQEMKHGSHGITIYPMCQQEIEIDKTRDLIEWRTLRNSSIFSTLLKMNEKQYENKGWNWSVELRHFLLQSQPCLQKYLDFTCDLVWFVLHYNRDLIEHLKEGRCNMKYLATGCFRNLFKDGTAFFR